MSELALHSQQGGQAKAQGPLSALNAFLGDYPRWVKAAFAPLKAEPVKLGHYRVSLPTMGALGFAVTPDLDVFLFQCDECRHGIQGVQPTVNGIYTIKLDGEFLLTPLEHEIAIHWQVDLGVSVKTPAFLDLLPAPVVKNVGSQVLTSVSSVIGDRFLRQLLAQYRAYGYSATQ